MVEEKELSKLLMTDFLNQWQTLIGALIGAAAPFVLFLLAGKYKEKREAHQYLYYLQRVIIDQINCVLDIKNTTVNFLDFRIKELLKNIDSNPTDAYSINVIFFPLFSVRPIPDDVNKKSSGSGYIDNKIAKVYAMSNDLPHIVNDIRIQLQETLSRNERMATQKLNSPTVQKEQFKENIKLYEKMMREDILLKNIPIFLSKLYEVLIPLQEKLRTRNLIWKIKFDPRWKFYVTKKSYREAQEKLLETMDAYFQKDVTKYLNEIAQ